MSRFLNQLILMGLKPRRFVLVNLATSFVCFPAPLLYFID